MTAAGTASAGAGAAAGGAAVGFGALAVSIGSIAAAALIAAAAMYGLDKLLHGREDKELQANIKRGDEAGKRLLQIENAKRAKKGLAPVTAEEFQPDANADDASSGGLDPAQIEKLQAQLAALKSGGSTPGTESPDVPNIPINITPTASGAADALDGASTPGDAAGNTSDAPSTDDTRSMKRDLAALPKGKEYAAQRAALQTRIRDAQWSQQDAKKAESEAKKQEAARNKSVRIGGGVLDDRMESAARIQKARMEAAGDLAREESDAALEAQIAAIEERVSAGKLDEAASHQQIAELRAAHARSEKQEEAAQKLKVAAIEAESVLSQARAEAMGKSVEEQKAVMEKAQIKASEIKTLAQIDADKLTREGDFASRREMLKAKKEKRDSWGGVLPRLQGGDSLADVRDKQGRAILGNLSTPVAPAVGAAMGGMLNWDKSSRFAGFNDPFAISHPIPGTAAHARQSLRGTSGAVSGYDSGGVPRDEIMQVGHRKSTLPDGRIRIKIDEIIIDNEWNRVGSRL